MCLILIGPPGGGKGTQANLLHQRLGLLHVGTGDILREAMRLDTSTGQQAKPFVTTGQLVPDHLVNQMVDEYFDRHGQPARFVMDGYPRTLAQADALDRMLDKYKLKLAAVVHLKVDDLELVRRLSGRWSCPNPECSQTYHTISKPPRRPGICDVCGTALVQREDDKEETVRKRLKIYHQNFDGLIEHYRAGGLLREVDGRSDMETVYAKIAKILKGGC